MLAQDRAGRAVCGVAELLRSKTGGRGEKPRHFDYTADDLTTAGLCLAVVQLDRWVGLAPVVAGVKSR